METSGVYFGSLKMFILSAKLEKNSHRHFSQHVGYSEPKNIRRIDVFVHDSCSLLPRNNADVTHCEKKPSFLFKTKQSTELKTGQQLYVLK